MKMNQIDNFFAQQIVQDQLELPDVELINLFMELIKWNWIWPSVSSSLFIGHLFYPHVSCTEHI